MEHPFDHSTWWAAACSQYVHEQDRCLVERRRIFRPLRKRRPTFRHPSSPNVSELDSVSIVVATHAKRHLCERINEAELNVSGNCYPRQVCRPPRKVKLPRRSVISTFRYLKLDKPRTGWLRVPKPSPWIRCLPASVMA